MEKVVSVFKSDEEKARAECGRLNAAREKLVLGRSGAEAELTTLRQGLPDAELDRLLDGVDSTPTHERIAVLETTIEAANAALTALGPRLHKAHAALRQIKADAIVRQADQLAAKRAALVKKSEAVIRELEEVTGAKWIPLAIYNRDVYAAMAATGKNSHIDGGLPPSPPPRYDLLASEEQGLRQRAVEILRLPIRENGQAQGSSVDALLADVAEQLKADLLIAPSEAEVRGYFNADRITAAEAAWAKSIESVVPLRTGGTTTRASVTRFVLVWAQGRIDPATSRVSLAPAPEGVRTGPLSKRDAGPAYST
jgi:hypothetical protein